jgi:hypothetical protein
MQIGSWAVGEKRNLAITYTVEYMEIFNCGQELFFLSPGSEGERRGQMEYKKTGRTNHMHTKYLISRLISSTLKKRDQQMRCGIS